MDEYSDISDDKGKSLEKDNLEDRHPGELSLIKMSDNEINDFIDYMSHSYNGTYLDLLYSIIGPEKILLYLETLENLTVRIPPKKTISKIVFYIKVYNYLKNREFSEEAYKNASKIFGKRVFDIKRVVNKVENILKEYSNERL